MLLVQPTPLQDGFSHPGRSIADPRQCPRKPTQTQRRGPRRDVDTNQRDNEQFKSMGAQLAVLSSKVANLVMRLQHYEPRSESKNSRTVPANRAEGTSKAKDSREAEMRLQEHKVSNYASNNASTNHKESPHYHGATTLGQNKHAQEWQEQVQSGEPLWQDIKSRARLVSNAPRPEDGLNHTRSPWRIRRRVA